MLDIFPQNMSHTKYVTYKSVTYKRNENVREILSLSLFPRTTKHNQCSIKECNRKRDIYKNFLVVSPDFTCFATKRKYKIKGILKCDSTYVIYPISCKCCGKNILGLPLALKKDLEFTKVV